MSRPRQTSPARLHVLVLQGGGALGAYQAGTYEAMEEAGVRPNWIVGTSIGAINGALIAGNPPESRVTQLRTFWHRTAHRPLLLPPALQTVDSVCSETRSLVAGVPGFFTPRAPWTIPFALNWGHASVSFYDTDPLRQTLARLVDFDRLRRHGATRLSVGAVDVANGELRYFDSAAHALMTEHIMASGALPPGFPPVLIDNVEYWDGGIYSNTPLSYVVDDATHQSKVCFAVDLWQATGAIPTTLLEAAARVKEIPYASRTRRWIHTHKTIHDRPTVGNPHGGPIAPGPIQAAQWGAQHFPKGGNVFIPSPWLPSNGAGVPGTRICARRSATRHGSGRCLRTPASWCTSSRATAQPRARVQAIADIAFEVRRIPLSNRRTAARFRGPMNRQP